MKWKLVFGMLAGLQIAALVNGAPDVCAEDGADCHPEITVRVYDYSVVPEGIARRAKAEVERIFAEAGVKVNWAVCPVSAETMPGDPTCHLRPSSTDIRLNFLTAEMAKEIAPEYIKFGAAFPLKSGFGNLAAVFPERISEFAASHGAPEALLLGHFIAHEIGHLLLGVNSHSKSGLMHVPWSRSQIERAYVGTLLFSRNDVDRIQQKVSARVLAARSRPPGRLPDYSPHDHVATLARR